MSMTVTIPNFSPALATRQQEVEKIHRMLKQCGQDLHAAGGAKTSGNLIDGGPQGVTVFGTWTYTPQATAP
jgi:hypothetical protein